VRYTDDTKKLLGNAYRGVSVTAADPVPVCSFVVGTHDVINNGTVCQYTPTAEFKYWSYTAGIDHTFMDGVFGYFKTSKTQKSGGNQIRAVNGDVTPFGPESLTDYEVGMKLDLLDSRLRFNADYYYGNYDAIQYARIVQLPTGTSTAIVNIGNADIQGVEVELTAKLPVGFGIEGGGSWNGTKFADPTYNQFFFPKYQFNLAATYETDTGLGELLARLDYFWKGSVEKQAQIAPPASPSLLLPSYNTLNARVTMKLDAGIDVSVWCRNLTNEKYFSDALALSPTNVAYPGDPRKFGVEISKKF